MFINKKTRSVMQSTESLFFRCAQCHTKNRIPIQNVSKIGRCGKCKAEMDTNELSFNTPIMVTDMNFGEKVIKSPISVLLDCFAPVLFFYRDHKLYA